MAKPIQPIPQGYHTVTPWIISSDTPRLIDFLVAAFDAEELSRLAGPDGRIGHAEVRIGDSVVMMFDNRPDWPETPAFMRLYFADGEEKFARALAAGATEVTRMTHLFWGDKVGRVRDPLGNLWWIHERIEEVDQAEAVRRMDDPEWQKRMEYVQGSLAF
jgi:uncharacterized glyoxalase superfamily protein PhnB